MQIKNEDAAKLRRGFREAGSLLHTTIRRQVPVVMERLTAAQIRMLEQLYRESRHDENGISLRQLALQLEITAAAASEMVDTLVRKNLVVREKNPEDRRTVFIRIAPECLRKFDEIEGNLDQLFSDFLSGISPEQQENAIALLQQLVDFLKSRISGKEAL